jgi:hypothetical protein
LLLQGADLLRGALHLLLRAAQGLALAAGALVFLRHGARHGTGHCHCQQQLRGPGSSLHQKSSVR